MHIVFVTSEMAPFAKTGGLADVLGALPPEVAKLGHRVSIFLPFYRRVKRQDLSLNSVLQDYPVPVGSEIENASLVSCQHGKVTVYFVANPGYFDRDELYGTPLGDYPDNDQRFTFFQRAVIEGLKRLKCEADVFHCHDWQTGLVPVYLKTLYRGDPFYKKTKTIFTIHNLAYQGNFPPDSLPLTGISWDEFRYQRLEFYGKVSFLKGGLVYSDALTTVSERYAKEIQTPALGSGMDAVLAYRKEHLFGVINGINPDDWDPEHDPDLPANYSGRDWTKKALCKKMLQKEHHLVMDPEIPLFCFVGRLADQKGLDILASALEEMVKEGWQFVLLGTGEDKYHHLLRDLGKHYPKNLAINITFDNKLAKRIYAGSDFFLMPSQFEPCGLGQMIALRFGTIPIVRLTGGLADTISEFDAPSGKGNGFIFSNFETTDLMKAMERAVAVFQNKAAWTKLVKNGMAADFSWAHSARRYVELYERIEKKTVKV